MRTCWSGNLTWRRLVVVGFLVGSAPFVLAAGSQSANITVLENHPARLVVQCTVQPDQIRQTAVSVDGQPAVTLALPGEAPLLVAGAPDLAHAARSVAIPDTGGMTLQVLEAQASYYEVANIDIAPSKGTLLRTVDPADVPYVKGDVYSLNAFYPGTLAAAREPYILRDIRGMVVDFFPLQYNPVTRTLRVYTTLQAVITPTGGPGANEIDRAQVVHKPSTAFSALYRSQFINYDPVVDYNPLNEVGNLLIICYDAWLPNMAAFVSHKNGIGLPTTLVGISAVGNNPTSIKNYIQNVYNQGNLAFVLLVGASAQVATPTYQNGAADPTYALLAGSDNYPDIMVGRFAATTAGQVDTQVQRTVVYEDNQSPLTDWYWRGTGIGSQYGAGQGHHGEADYTHIGLIRTLLLSHGYTLVDEFYGTNGANATMVTNALNAGRGIINYCGHGSQNAWDTTGFSSSNVAALVNDNKLPFIFSVACVNGDFTHGTCFAEAWMWATHNGQPTGAIGTYMSSINQYWTEPMDAQDEFNQRLVDAAHPYHDFGTLCFAGSCRMMDLNGSSGVDMFKTWHVFGDPSVRIVGTVTPPLHPGDMNCDGAVNFLDINPFVLALSDPAGYQAAYPNCNLMNGDTNGDGLVDFNDINPFVELLTGK